MLTSNIQANREPHSRMKSKDTWCLIENYVLKNNLRIYSYLSILVFSQSDDDDHGAS